MLVAGLKVIATRGTTAALKTAGIEVEPIYKVNEGRPNIVDLIKTGKVNLVINTPLGRESFYDEKSIRRAAIRYNVPCITTLSAARAAAGGIRAMAGRAAEVFALQDLHRRKSASAVPADRAPLLIARREGIAVTDSPVMIPGHSTICQCNGVTKATIRAAWEDGARDADGVAARTRASTGCGTCRSCSLRLTRHIAFRSGGTNSGPNIAS